MEALGAALDWLLRLPWAFLAWWLNLDASAGESTAPSSAPSSAVRLQGARRSGTTPSAPRTAHPVRRMRLPGSHATLGLDGARCPVCGGGVADAPAATVRCRKCQTPHHADCFRYAAGCAVYACGCSSALPAQAPTRRPRDPFRATATFAAASPEPEPTAVRFTLPRLDFEGPLLLALAAAPFALLLLLRDYPSVWVCTAGAAETLLLAGLKSLAATARG